MSPTPSSQTEAIAIEWARMHIPLDGLQPTSPYYRHAAVWIVSQIEKRHSNRPEIIRVEDQLVGPARFITRLPNGQEIALVPDDPMAGATITEEYAALAQRARAAGRSIPAQREYELARESHPAGRLRPVEPDSTT